MPELKISCIIPVFNESARVIGVIDAIIGHELVDEVIVVNDGSRDDTEAVLKNKPGIKLVSYQPNRGKSHAVKEGFKAARNDLVMMIDSDLIGLNKDNITALIEPLIKNRADATISLRKNSLLIYKLFGIDFFSGERVFNKKIIERLEDLDAMPGFGLESYLNKILIRRKMRLRVVRWNNVISPRKSVKFGFWAGVWGDTKMLYEIVSFLGFFGAIRMLFQMLWIKV